MTKFVISMVQHVATVVTILGNNFGYKNLIKIGLMNAE